MPFGIICNRYLTTALLLEATIKIYNHFNELNNKLSGVLKSVLMAILCKVFLYIIITLNN